jgi:CMP-N-acetylneuraminic acid synthetase
MTEMIHGTVALMPLKAESVRVPHKNFRPFRGRPLVWWMLDTLLSLRSIEKVVVNTDARSHLAKVGVLDSDRVLIRDRKPELCGNAVSMNLVLSDDINHVQANRYLMTHTTNPLLSAKTIKAAITALNASDCDSLFTVNRHQARFYDAYGAALNHDPENLIPTQHLEPWFEENSNLYIFTRESFEKTKARIGNRPLMFSTPRLESFDIDTWEDWHMAEAAALALQRERGQTP